VPGLPEVPERLRHFSYVPATDVPVEFLSDGWMRAFRRWLDARRAWEHEHGVTLAELDDRVWEAAGQRGTLEALGEAAAFIDPEEPDPRGR